MRSGARGRKRALSVSSSSTSSSSSSSSSTSSAASSSSSSSSSSSPSSSSVRRRCPGAGVRRAVASAAADSSDAAGGGVASLERVDVSSAAELRAWLVAHHAQQASVWLRMFRRGHARHVPYEEVIRELLCFGWIDGRGWPDQPGTSRLLMISKRRPRSVWSVPNKRRLEQLLREQPERVHAQGREAAQAAKDDGRWTMLDDAAAMLVPADLRAALDAAASDGRASVYFDAFPPGARRGILGWIAVARRPETRARRIAETASKAARNKRAHVDTRRDAE